MYQHTTTVAVPLGDRHSARGELHALAKDRRYGKSGVHHGPAVFADLGIHFGRIVLVEEPGGSPFTSWLLLESNFDSREEERAAAIEEHLRRLAKERHRELAPLFGTCKDGGRAHTPDGLAAIMLANLVESTAEYQGHASRDLDRIELESQIYTEAIACAARLPPATPSAEVHARVRAHVASLSLPGLDLDGAPPSEPDPARRHRELKKHVSFWFKHLGKLGASGVAGAVATLASERFMPQYDLQGEAESRGPERAARQRACAESEDHGAHNALTHLVPVRKTFVWRTTLRALHRYLDGVARDHFNSVGMLGGIPSIHFAKWMLIDGGKRLLFFSNYDGNWESYLGDFVDGAAQGLNAAWTCTQGYPRTKAILWGGANDEERFKAWARSHQLPTHLFYSAYPKLSVANINDATWTRHGLHQRNPSGDALEAWRRRLT